jgi:phosphohistidine phosphatase
MMGNMLIMRLYLMRHAQASNMADSDHARPLTQKGEDRTRSAAKALKKLEIEPTILYASPRVRAQQTAAIIAEALGLSVTTSEKLNFEFDLRALEELIADQEPDAQIMLVGHNPSMTEVVRQLTGANANMKTGSIACVDVMPDMLRGGLLNWLTTPKIFETLA